MKHPSTPSPHDNAAPAASWFFFDLQRNQPIEPGRVGFVADGQWTPRPDHAVTAYRAAADGFAQSMSWTDHLRVALWFHRRNLSAGLDSAVYAARFDPKDLFGYFNYSTGEHEWVVRPSAAMDQLDRVDIEDLSLPDRHPGRGL